MSTYRIEAESEAALIAKLEAADPALVVTGESNVKRVQQSCVTNPRLVMTDGVPVIDPDFGAYVPQVPVIPEIWFSTVEVTGENASLALVAS